MNSRLVGGRVVGGAVVGGAVVGGRVVGGGVDGGCVVGGWLVGGRLVGGCVVGGCVVGGRVVGRCVVGGGVVDGLPVGGLVVTGGVVTSPVGLWVWLCVGCPPPGRPDVAWPSVSATARPAFKTIPIPTGTEMINAARLARSDRNLFGSNFGLNMRYPPPAMCDDSFYHARRKLSQGLSGVIPRKGMV
ncbi:hypothetical protein [Streptomyces sp. SID3343]|uniref:hypothetical protein n=1 Tax=Streptomyces sp. SID3343 TaxID=2690260 RepID=UPI0013689FA9|nr:hypothetical protein [Streptomyces sp. SID3343]